jgi:hypothetical protein
MMSISNQFLLLVFLTINLPILIKSKPPDNLHRSYCLVRNSEYENEYLYSSRKDLDTNENMIRKVYANSANKVNIKSLDQMRWIFVPVDWLNDAFYITNIEFNEHLCASHVYRDSSTKSKKRRLVNLIKMNKESLKTNKKCIWRTENIISNDGNESSFYLWNLYYHEPLYAAASLNKIMNQSKDRNVYTWHQKPDSKQFIWFIYCSKALNLNWKANQSEREMLK